MSTPWARRRARLAANPGGAIYGTIVATAVIAAAGQHQPAGIVLAETVVTLLVFWLAHVYAQVLSQPVRNVPATMGRELALLEAPAPSVLLLLLAALGLLGKGLAVNLALATAVAALVWWGVLTARRLGRAWPAALFAGAVDGVLGVVIIALKALLP